MRDLISVLLDQRAHKIDGSIYNKLQVDFAFNSNRIEGSHLTHDQTRYIFETKSVNGDNIRVDDVIETVNHFRCFDHILDTYDEGLTEDYIKDLHRILKSGTVSSGSVEAVVGEYKKYANEVADIRTSLPEKVSSDMKDLIGSYEGHTNDLEGIVTFHVSFEKIHPFYDGNGRVGRLIMFKECLRNKILPFIVNDQDKLFYYMGLKEWQTEGKTGRLMETVRLMQDDMESVLRYFDIEIPSRGEEQ